MYSNILCAQKLFCFFFPLVKYHAYKWKYELLLCVITILVG